MKDPQEELLRILKSKFYNPEPDELFIEPHVIGLMQAAYNLGVTNSAEAAKVIASDTKTKQEFPSSLHVSGNCRVEVDKQSILNLKIKE